MVLLVLSLGCAAPPPPGGASAEAGIDSLNERLVQAYRDQDPQAYARLFTDTARFEWEGFTATGPAELEAMARANWLSLNEMDLRLRVSVRRMGPDHATEFGAFEQSWSDSAGVRTTEYGRYATLFARADSGGWRMDRFLGFADSTRRDSASR